MKKIIIFLLFLFCNNIFAQIQINSVSLDSIVKYKLGLEMNDIITEENALTLTDLDASAQNIDDLTGLSAFKNLRILNLNTNKISDVSEIALLPNLQFVDLSNNSISDVLPLLVSLSESVRIDVSQNCIDNFDIIKKNLINSVTFVGEESQKVDCASYPTILHQFDVVSTNINTREVKFLYRGFHPTEQNGTITFGNGESTNVILNGYTQDLTYNYSSNDDYLATLSLNDSTLTTHVGLAINPLVLISPDNNASDTIGGWEGSFFKWNNVIGASKYIIHIMKNEEIINGRTTEINQLDFNIFNLEDEGTYQWKVKALSNDNSGPWSETFTFSIVETLAEIHPYIIANAFTSSRIGTLGLNNFSNKEIQVYPNPVQDFFIIDSKNFELATIYDINGETINNFTSKNIDLRGLNSGEYILKIKNKENRVKLIKIVKKD